ncbi:hypothetical protein CP97_06130 [Aurantiacibacter atlanticus]|uniref:Glycosyltransferase RgtA/B/C/D-like domain-containing protein n=1 Tax=Aurantiacibacter atlanticus TaxID=1648404 RepID=A0A0H4VF57_9SPHN|nr:hypothetical protein [Aurantiacibacter atlanticus]AKQ41689.1 hypothetical protein CP97_06130 [Aurantiacibacter atlanticus]
MLHIQAIFTVEGRRMEEHGKAYAWNGVWVSWLMPAFILVSLACLAGRILSYPINRDEHMFVTVAQQWPNADLYRDLGFNHLPNLAILFSSVFALTGTDHYLMATRLLILAAWAAALILIWLIGRRMGVSNLAIVAAMALLVGNITLLGPPGMLATNSFIPIPFSFLAFLFVLGALDEDYPRKRRIAEAFLSGVAVSLAIGFKANFIIIAPCFFIASVLARQSQPLIERLRFQCLPLCFGGLVGGFPSLLAFARDFEGMVAHTLRYFTELHSAFWVDSTEPKAVSFADKILLAEEIWLGGTTLLVIVGICVMAVRPFTLAGLRGGMAHLLRWQVILMAALVLLGIVISFVPTPSFSQYFVPPIPFLLLAFLSLAPASGVGRSQPADLGDGDVRTTALLLSLIALALIAGSVRLLPGLAALANPARWTGIATYSVMHDALDREGLAVDARIATLSPLLAIEGGRDIYPEFAAGQFVFRVAPYMTAEERQHYRTTSPEELTQFLDANQPDAILVDIAEPLEARLSDYAVSHGYREVEGGGERGALEFKLYISTPP